MLLSRRLNQRIITNLIARQSRAFSSQAGVEDIKQIGIVGSGQMGTGIGIVASRVAGLNVVFVDPSEASLKKSEKVISSWCNKEIAKKRMTE